MISYLHNIVFITPPMNTAPPITPPDMHIKVARWLPIFIEGIREYEEPYRFLSIMGSMDLIEEAGPRLNGFAADLVQPLKKALDTREPTVVCIAIELMKAVLRTDPQVRPRDSACLKYGDEDADDGGTYLQSGSIS